MTTAYKNLRYLQSKVELEIFDLADMLGEIKVWINNHLVSSQDQPLTQETEGLKHMTDRGLEAGQLANVIAKKLALIHRLIELIMQRDRVSDALIAYAHQLELLNNRLRWLNQELQRIFSMDMETIKHRLFKAMAHEAQASALPPPP